jgi:Bacterial membrane protein YfhO
LRTRLGLVAAFVILFSAPIAFHWQTLTRTDRTLPWDFVGFHLPHLVVMHEAASAGQFPFWDKYNYCGRPFAANPQTESFYPPRWITVAASPRVSDLVGRFELEVIAHVLLAGLFAALLARRLACDWPAASLAGVAYACGSFFSSQIQHTGAIEGAAWLPAIWWAVARLVERPAFVNVVWLSVLFTVAILTGCTPGLLVIYASAAMFCGILVWWKKTPALPLALRFGGAALISALLAGIQLVPSVEFALHSVGKYRLEWRGSGGGIPWEAFVSLVAPHFYGANDTAIYRLPYDITQTYLFNGYIPLLLLIAGTFLLRRNRAALGLFGMLGLIALLMLGDKTFAGLAIWHILPPLLRASYYPYYWMMVFSLGFAVVAALSLQSVRVADALKLVAVAATAFELVWFSSGMSLNSAEYVPTPPGARELQGSRYDITKGTHEMLAVTAPLVGALSANGYDPLALERIIQSRLFVAEGKRWGALYKVEQPNAPMLEAMNVDTLLSREPIPNAAPTWDLVQSSPVLVYKRRVPSNRFHFVESVTQVDEMEQAVEAARRPDWSPRTTAVIEQGRIKAVTQQSAVGSVTEISERPGEFRLRTTNTRPGFLFVSETYYPGWRAQIDRKAARVVPANVAFQGLWVPAGQHDVVLSYNPTIFAMGAALSISCAALLTLALVLTRRFARSPRYHTDS